jgi:regulator of protease activity HflC (stomatin/prohibitin superfamily)
MEGALVVTALRSIARSIPRRALATKGIFNATVARTTLFNGITNSVHKKTTQASKRSFITLIRQGQVGVRLLLGKDPVILEPGLHIKLPILHSLRKVDLREGSIDVIGLNACTKDNVPVVVSGTLFYKIHDALEACFKVQDVLVSVNNLGTSAMRSVIGTLQYDDIIADRTQINHILSSHIGDACKNWGISCTKFEIQRFEPQNSKIQNHLEMQMEAERRRRQQELDTKATINVADGHRQSMILESSGKLEAKRNEADGQFYQEQRLSDAKKYAIEMQAKAVAIEIQTYAEAMKISAAEAGQYLLEMKRLEHLKSLAMGKNVKTYFMPPDNSIYPNMKVMGDLFNSDLKGAVPAAETSSAAK